MLPVSEQHGHFKLGFLPRFQIVFTVMSALEEDSFSIRHNSQAQSIGCAYLPLDEESGKVK